MLHFHLPTEIFLESNCIQNHTDRITQTGSRALIVTGSSSSRKNGALSAVTQALASKGVPYTVFDQVEQNPSVDTVMKAAEIGLSDKADFVIGIGGGSPLDAAKAISFMIANPGHDSSYLYQDVPVLKHLPVIAVPTTCGTGSEVTGYSVLTVPSKKTKVTAKHRIFPCLALIDPGFLSEAPFSVIRNTAMDALAHMWESVLNTNATEISRNFAETGLATWKRNLAFLRTEGERNEERLKDLMLASTYAGICIAHTGTSIPHGLSYILTYDLHIPHGAAVGYFLAGYLEQGDPETRAFLLNASGFRSTDDFREFYQDVCGPIRVPEDTLHKTVSVLLQNTAKLKCCPYPVPESVLRKIAGL